MYSAKKHPAERQAYITFFTYNQDVQTFMNDENKDTYYDEQKCINSRESCWKENGYQKNEDLEHIYKFHIMFSIPVILYERSPLRQIQSFLR